MTRDLEAAEFDYMLTGSIVSSLQGQPRSTHDIDLVVMLRVTDVPTLIRIFPEPRFYHSEAAIVEAIQGAGHFNLIDTETGFKIDFWLLTTSAFDQSRFARRVRQSFFGQLMYASTPEDTILQKLVWSMESGGSERQFNDAKAVYEVNESSLDLQYMNAWAARLGIEHLWQAVKAA